MALKNLWEKNGFAIEVPICNESFHIIYSSSGTAKKNKVEIKPKCEETREKNKMPNLKNYILMAYPRKESKLNENYTTQTKDCLKLQF